MKIIETTKEAFEVPELKFDKSFKRITRFLVFSLIILYVAIILSGAIVMKYFFPEIGRVIIGKYLLFYFIFLTLFFPLVYLVFASMVFKIHSDTYKDTLGHPSEISDLKLGSTIEIFTNDNLMRFSYKDKHLRVLSGNYPAGKYLVTKEGLKRV